MPPIDPDDAVLRALRAARRAGAGSEPVDGPDAAALLDELDAPLLGRLGRATAGARPLVPLEEPPATLWDAIAAQLGLDASTGPARDEPPGRAELPGVAGPHGAVDLAARRRRRFGWAMAAAAAIVVVVGVVAFVNRAAPPEVVVEVALQPLEGVGAGDAKVIERPDGHREVEVSEQFAEVPAGSYVEVWLIDPTSNLQRMVSLGSIDGTGTYAVPDGIDVATYRVVDVSIEPADGVPTHSGRSILRGLLPL